MHSHIAPAHHGGKLEPGPYAARLRQVCPKQRADETAQQWRRRLRYEAMTAAALHIETGRLKQLLDRTEGLRAERVAKGIRLRWARDTRKRPPASNSIERKAIHYDSIQHEIRAFTGLQPLASHLNGNIPALHDEMTSAAHEAIVKALGGFDPSRGYELSTYVKVSVKNAVRGIAKPGVRDAMADKDRLVSLSQPIGHGEDGGALTTEDTLTDGQSEPELQLPDAAWDYLKQAIPDRVFGVLASRQQGSGRREISERLGLSVERVRQIEVDALARAADVLRPEVERGALVPVYGGGDGFQAEQWHLEALQGRILRATGLKATSRELPFALERMAERGGHPWPPSSAEHHYPPSLGKVWRSSNGRPQYWPPQIEVTDKNRAALRAASKTAGPLPSCAGMYSHFNEDDAPNLRGRSIPWTKLPPSDQSDGHREMVEVAPHQYVNRKAAEAPGLVKPLLFIIKGGRKYKAPRICGVAA